MTLQTQKFAPMVENQMRSTYLNEVVTICHLTGKPALNGQKGTVIGYDNVVEKMNTQDPIRLHVSLLDKSIVRIKPKNVRTSTSNYTFSEMTNHVIDTSKLHTILANIVHQEDPHSYGERQDMIRRYNYYAEHHQSSTSIPPVQCKDTFLSPLELKQDEHFMPYLMSLVAIDCVSENNLVQFDKFHEGLVGLDTECSICLTAIPKESDVCGLPCLHTFHRGCLSTWLKEHNTCPTCRFTLPCDGAVYEPTGWNNVHIRLKEWIISGLCHRCQAQFMEKDPLVSHTLPSGHNILIQQSKLPSDTKVGWKPDM